MRRKRKKWLRIALGAAAVATVAAGVASTASAHGVTSITIRHQLRGCHTWSASGGAFRPTLRITVDRDRLVQFVNNDVMPHRLVQTKGPKAHVSGANMNRMGARAQLTFPHKGVYAFTTRAGEDYPSMKEMRTIGEDYVLRLFVTVK